MGTFHQFKSRPGYRGYFVNDRDDRLVGMVADELGFWPGKTSEYIEIRIKSHKFGMIGKPDLVAYPISGVLRVEGKKLFIAASRDEILSDERFSLARIMSEGGDLLYSIN